MQRLSKKILSMIIRLKTQRNRNKLQRRIQLLINLSNLQEEGMLAKNKFTTKALTRPTQTKE